MTNNTIAAIATPLGTGGIGIIRISGPTALSILKRLFSRTKSPVKNDPTAGRVSSFASHRIHYGFVIDPLTNAVIDEILAIYMKGPKSYTRENVVEIHSHSGFVVLEKILELVLDLGAQLAEPGEFTKRAFLNGRIDLTQAESIIDLINAPCEMAAQMASRQITGGFREAVQEMAAAATDLMARCEAQIEFSDELEEEENIRIIVEKVDTRLVPRLEELIRRQKETAIYREGFTLTIAGMPNVGKSSLLNQLVQREAAIVSEIPGTTRDVVRDYISINGLPVMICDTAGIQETQDPVECIGIQKAKDQIREADLVLLVLDGSRKRFGLEKRMIEKTQDRKCIAVINKMDIGDSGTMAEIEAAFGAMSPIRVSAKFGTNIERLKERIFSEMVKGNGVDYEHRITPNLRQRKILENTVNVLKQFRADQSIGNDLEIVSQTLAQVRTLLGEITGDHDKDSLYDHIFKNFCIGK